MTGNNMVWRSPLAGLAAVAMLATMGVAASTANAAAPGAAVVTGRHQLVQVRGREGRYSGRRHPRGWRDGFADATDALNVTFQAPSTTDYIVVGADADGTTNTEYTSVGADGAADVKVPNVIDMTGAKVFKQWQNTRTGKFYAIGATLTTADAAKGDKFVLDETATGTTAQHTVTFDLNGGNGKIAPVTVKDGEAVAKPADPTREGYVFQGWKAVRGASNNKEGFYDFDSQVKGDITLQAQWAKVANVKVTFSVGNSVSAGGDKTVTVAGDAFVDLSQAPEFKRDGYSQPGWFVDYNANGKQDGADKTFNALDQLAGQVNGGKNFTLTAVWSLVDSNAAKNALDYVTTGLGKKDGTGAYVLGGTSNKDWFTTDS